MGHIVLSKEAHRVCRAVKGLGEINKLGGTMKDYPKKNYVSVLVDPSINKRIWVHPNNIIVNINGLDLKLGEVLDDLTKNKTTQKEFEDFKLKTKKTIKDLTDIVKILVTQTELNNLNINSINDNLEDLNIENK